MNADDLSTVVYTGLLAEPELRQGPIGLIIMGALSEYVAITDRDGNPID